MFAAVESETFAIYVRCKTRPFRRYDFASAVYLYIFEQRDGIAALC